MALHPRDDVVSFNRLARELGIHASTLFRWTSPRGVRGQRLVSHLRGGRRFVFRADFEDFLRRLNGAAPTNRRAAPRQEERRVRQVEQALEAEGL